METDECVVRVYPSVDKDSDNDEDDYSHNFEEGEPIL